MSPNAASPPHGVLSPQPNVMPPHFPPSRPPSAVFPPKRQPRSGDLPRAKRRHQRRASSENQGKITEYFKTQIKPLVGIKRDYNYQKKEPFCWEPDAKKPCETAPCDTNIKKDDYNIASQLLLQKPAGMTLFSKILENHKQRNFVESSLKARLDGKSKESDTEAAKTKQKTEESCERDDCVTPTPQDEPAAEPLPILSTPITIRFPVVEEKDKSLPTTSTSQQYACRWKSCSRVCDSTGPLVDHLQNAHVLAQGCGEKFVCLWVGCKVFGQKSCSRTWLERHVLTHAGSKPYRCIVDGCGQAFSTQSILQRHVNSHFQADVKKALDISGGQKLIRRNGKKLRYRRQPWSARSLDFFDIGTLEALEHRLVQTTMARSGGCVGNTPPGSIVFSSQVTASRISPSGEKQFLVTWHPHDLLDDEWLPAGEVKSRRTVPIRNLPHSAQVALQDTLGLSAPRRQGRKTRRKLPLPPRPPVLPSTLPEPVPETQTVPALDTMPPPICQAAPEMDATATAVVAANLAPATCMELVPFSPVGKVRRKRKRSTKLKSPVDPYTLPVAKVPLVDIAKTLPKPMLMVDDSLPAHQQQHSFFLNGHPYKLVSSPPLLGLMTSPVASPVTYQLPVHQSPPPSLFLLPPQQSPMFQTIHISSNIVQQQSILTSLNLKSQTLLLVNSTKQVSLSVTSERPKGKVQILPKPECLLPIRGPT